MQTEIMVLMALVAAVLVAQGIALLRGGNSQALEQRLREELRIERAELRELITDLSTGTDAQLDQLRRSGDEQARQAREEIQRGQQQAAEMTAQRLVEMRAQLDTGAQAQESRLRLFGEQLGALARLLEQQQQATREALLDDTRRARQEGAEGQQRFAEALGQRLAELTARNEQGITQMRATLEQQLRALQNDNAARLEQMRVTVDEKLTGTLNTRLDASFKLVSERLEQVQRGLGEMQALATGVGDLKRVLSNVKTRGSWGEVQLEAILEQTLTNEQFARSVRLRPDSREMVDFAVRLPGQGGNGDLPVWLPIDSKFPREDYERLLDAQEAGDAEGVRQAGAQLERALRIQAKSIADKYVVPPYSTDFAVMFLPTEGLYAEALRRPGLGDALQREHRVVLAGPTTVTALLNSLQMGFRTLAIEQRSSEVWQLLGAVKGEFGKFATVLEKATNQLGTVQKTISSAGVRTRVIERKLRSVESLADEDARQLIGETAGLLETGEGEDDPLV